MRMARIPVFMEMANHFGVKFSRVFWNADFPCLLCRSAVRSSASRWALFGWASSMPLFMLKEASWRSASLGAPLVASEGGFAWAWSLPLLAEGLSGCSRAPRLSLIRGSDWAWTLWYSMSAATENVSIYFGAPLIALMFGASWGAGLSLCILAIGVDWVCVRLRTLWVSWRSKSGWATLPVPIFASQWL